MGHRNSDGGEEDSSTESAQPATLPRTTQTARGANRDRLSHLRGDLIDTKVHLVLAILNDRNLPRPLPDCGERQVTIYGYFSGPRDPPIQPSPILLAFAPPIVRPPRFKAHPLAPIPHVSASPLTPPSRCFFDMSPNSSAVSEISHSIDSTSDGYSQMGGRF